MKLTATEVKILSGLSTRRTRRKWDAWLSFLSTIALVVITYDYGMFPTLIEWPFLGIATGATLSYLVHVYFAVRREDKLISLLKRYVNRDPEAVVQLSGAVGSDAVAA